MDTELLQKIWQTELGDHEKGRHLTSSEIFDLLIREDVSDRDAMLKHLSLCPRCREEFHKMYEAQKETEFLDIALPQLAGAKGVSGSMKIYTQGGKYKITIKPSLKEEDLGMITLEPVKKHLREELEGTIIALSDANGRLLLEGTVVNSQVSQKIDDLDNIDIQYFKIDRR